MKQKITIDGLDCMVCRSGKSQNLAYILYPMDILDNWIESAAERYGVSIAIITGMDWDNVFSPWPSPGQPPGSPDFKGESGEFLSRLQTKVIPQIESSMGYTEGVARSLVGVSMSGLFALWQWMVCDTFTNIACLSGSFWYPGFIEWFMAQKPDQKEGKAYFLLGTQEPKSPVKAFRSVGENTATIVEVLKRTGISVEFQSVPGNHYSNPLPRLDAAFSGLFR